MCCKEVLQYAFSSVQYGDTPIFYHFFIWLCIKEATVLKNDLCKVIVWTVLVMNITYWMFGLAFVSGIPNLSIVPYMSKRVPKGSKVIYTCKAHNATVCDNLQWSKVNGLMNDVRVTSPWNNNGVWETELEIEKAAFAHSGRYKCELSYHQDLLAEDEVEVTVSGKCHF